MRLHSGLLAIALLVGVALACGGLNNNTANNANNGNANGSLNANNANGANAGLTNNSNNTNSNVEGVRINDMYMAEDAGGKYGDKTTSFKTSDKTVYVVAELSEAESGTKIKFVWTAVDVEGAGKGEKIKDIEYTTSALENKVNAHLTLPRDWPKGRYKVDAFVNERLDKSVEYTVE